MRYRSFGEHDNSLAYLKPLREIGAYSMRNEVVKGKRWIDIK